MFQHFLVQRPDEYRTTTPLHVQCANCQKQTYNATLPTSIILSYAFGFFNLAGYVPKCSKICVKSHKIVHIMIKMPQASPPSASRSRLFRRLTKTSFWICLCLKSFEESFLWVIESSWWSHDAALEESKPLTLDVTVVCPQLTRTSMPQPGMPAWRWN